MYLKRLELLGFKSFADKIKLEFMPGVTAVVGPNGSGKSNISDALRWVLGEQSVKNLRGSKMDDIIFAGTELRKPLGLAEVTMVLDNSDHSIALDFNEISITRKLFRSGESEYLINKSQVRLKDIHELFYDTGLGKDAYSVISQGKIDTILSAKAEERRSIFEEAAGIIKYKSRKQIAGHKLEETDRNLVRVQDIIKELQSQLGPLRTQSEIAQQYLDLKERLSELEINYYGIILQKLLGELVVIKQHKQETEEHYHDFEGEESVIDSQLEEYRLQLLNLDSQINNYNEAYFRIQNTIDKFTEQVNFLHSKLGDFERRELDYSKGMESNLGRQGLLSEEYGRLDNEILAIKERLTEEQNLLQAEEKLLNNLNEDLKSLEAKEESLKNELIEVLNTIALLKNKQNSTSLQKDFLLKQSGECLCKQGNLNNRLNELNQEFLAKKTNLQECRQKIEDLQKTRADELIKLNDFQKEQVVLEEKCQECRQKIRIIEGKTGLLEDMEKSFQGYFHGVKALLADSVGESFHSKIRGIVADLFKVRPGMELALETALGSSLQHIVIEDDGAAQDAITFLKRKSKGRATFLPLNRVRAYESRSNSIQALLQQYSCHTAISLLEFNPEYQQVINYLLSQVIVAPNLRTAIQVSGKLDRGFRIVTPEGDLVNPGGSITGGSNDRQRVGLLSRKREIEDLKQEKFDLGIALNEGFRKLQSKKEAVQILEKQLDELKNSENETQLSKVALERDLHTLTQNISHVTAELDLLKEQLSEFEDESAKFESGTEELSQEIQSSETLLKGIETSIRDLATDLDEAKQKKDGQIHKVTDLKSKLSAGLQEISGKEVLKNSLNKQLTEIDHFIQDLADKKEGLGTERGQVRQSLLELEAQITTENQNLLKQQELINTKKVVKEEHQAKVRELEGQQRNFRKKNNDFQNQLHRLDLANNQKENEIENTRKNLVQDYGLDWETKFNPQWTAPENSEALIDKLKLNLREMGTVNLAAIENYRQVGERAEFLSNQAEDLEKARASLQKVILEIERTIEKRFNETFDQIRKEFKKLFSELFAGGSADLFLINPEDPLGSGIEIVAQPPGKKLQSLSLLSGGERAMTTIALLFSILSIKPAPFCILDEIDSSLDEVNVQRFSRLLEIFSQDLQFIVVTHRRGTMEAANTLYGVTMEEMGISKLISLDLRDKAVQSA